MMPFSYRLYLVTDEQACLGRDLFWVVEEAIKGGVDVVQLREKQLDTPAFTQKAERLKQLLDKYHVPLIINDNVEVAKAVQAYGIHVGNSDQSPVTVRAQLGAEAAIGYSIEYETQLSTANAAVADYLALSPIFATPTKTDTVTEWGLEGIAHIRKQTQKPLVAIGHIAADNAGSIMKAGADCLAVVSAICSAEYPAYAAEKIRIEIERAATGSL